jgi:hypothetical protein
MSFLPVTSLMYLTSEFSEPSAMFSKKGQSLLNLLLKSMKISYLVMIQTFAHIMFSKRTPVVLKSHVTRCLLRLMALKRSKLILIL